MGLKHPNTSGFGTPGRCQQYALHPLCLPGIVSCLNSTLGSVVANDSTIPKVKQSLSVCMVKSGGFKIMTPLCGHTAQFRLSNAR